MTPQNYRSMAATCSRVMRPLGSVPSVTSADITQLVQLGTRGCRWWAPIPAGRARMVVSVPQVTTPLGAKVSAEIEELTAAAESAKRELDECVASQSAEQMEYKKLQSWADLYANCTFETRKMIACQFIKSVYVYRDYTLEVEFNVSFEDLKALGPSARGGPTRSRRSM